MSSNDIVDLRGKGCGSVLVELAALRRTLIADRTIRLWTDDLGADEELPAWCRMTGQHFGGRVDRVDEAWRYQLTLSPYPTVPTTHPEAL
jgi:tRNA 2-thiouridine synthesizing protein A